MHDRPRHYEEFEPRREVVPGAPSNVDAFLKWGAEQPEGFRYELSRGLVYKSMVNVSRAHALVASNIIFELMSRLDREKIQVSAAEFGVQTPFGARMPDIMVDPGGGPNLEKAAKQPILLVEVLSPSTENVDFTEKLEEYQAIASLRHYLICSQSETKVWLWSRADDVWQGEPDVITDLTGAVVITGLGIELPMAAIYRKVRFENQ